MIQRLLLLPRVFLAAVMFVCVAAHADAAPDYQLGAGDGIKIQVFQNPDLTVETRVSEDGSVTYPLIGAAKLGGLSIAAAEKTIADALQKGGFVKLPQVMITIQQANSNRVTVLGMVNRPGRVPLDSTNTRLSDLMADAYGVVPIGNDVVVVTGVRAGKPFRKLIDVPSIFLDDKTADDIVLQGGDTVYVHRASVFYIYGEAQRPGSYRLDRNMTVMQALALGGGTTARGSERGLRLHRQGPDGSIQLIEPKLTDPVLPNDVIYVRERIF